MTNGKSTRFLVTVMLLLSALPVAARNLPFAPPKAKTKQNPVVFSPFEHEAVMAQLEPGWTLRRNINEDKKVRIMQFFGPGSSEDDMKQMINVATYMEVPARQTAHDFMQHARRECEKMVPKEKLVWKTVSDVNPNDVTFEFSIKGWIDSPDQYELERVIRGKDGMHAVIYHLDNPDASDEQRKHALAWVRSVRLDQREDVADSHPEPSAH